MHSARRLDNLRSRFFSAGALIAVIDVRKAEAQGLKAIAELSRSAAEGGIAILALVDSGQDRAIVGQCFDAGATHYLDFANVAADLGQAIKYAYRFVENFRGGADRAIQEQSLLTSADLQWSASLGSGTDYWISENLLAAAGEIDLRKYPVTGIYRALSREEKKRARGAMGRLRDGARQAAIPHRFNGRPVLHHLHEADGRIFGRIEYLAKQRVYPVVDSGQIGRRKPIDAYRDQYQKFPDDQRSVRQARRGPIAADRRAQADGVYRAPL